MQGLEWTSPNVVWMAGKTRWQTNHTDTKRLENDLISAEIVQRRILCHLMESSNFPCSLISDCFLFVLFALSYYVWGKPQRLWLCQMCFIGEFWLTASTLCVRPEDSDSLLSSALDFLTNSLSFLFSWVCYQRVILRSIVLPMLG